MGLIGLLEKNKTSIIKKWFDKVADTYPGDTSAFIKSQKNPFANPVGSITLKGLEAVFSELLGQMNPEKIQLSLDPIIRVRAVQDFSPSIAAGFPFYLKQIIQELIEQNQGSDANIKEWVVFQQKIDYMGLIAFDIFMRCREQLYEIKANELRNRSFSALQRAGLLKDDALEREDI